MKKKEKKDKMKISQNRLKIENMFGLANKFLVLMDLIVKLFSHINMWLLTWNKYVQYMEQMCGRLDFINSAVTHLKVKSSKPNLQSIALKVV